MPFEPEDIEPGALKILNETGFVWDSQLLAFKRPQQTGAGHAREPQLITYEFLREQQLVVGSTLDQSARTQQLLRLRIVIESLD
ncbi:MAG TPA: hypothetical protein VN867_05640 [Candidatus Binataceae bacterium]|nr:hypothetical protein [Candidatus Binataceae bacterium]